MQFIVGSACISLSILTFCIVLLGARNPRKPMWASELWVGNCHSIIILMLGVGGIFALASGIFEFAATGTGDLVSILISATILAATILGIKVMKIKQKIAAFESRP
jgi:anaerobic C4-dicarboxylate transporter